MARASKRYKPEVKAKFIEAAAAARAAGKPWKAAYVAAQEAGYKGSIDALEKMLARKKVKKAAPAAPAVAQKAAPAAPKPAAKKQKPKSSPKPKAKRNYDAATKAAIVKAAIAARKAGKKWPEALVAAKAAGYRGGLVSLMLFVKAARKQGRPAKATIAAPAPKKRGRPPKVAAPAVPALDPVAAQYLVSAIDKAVAELEKLRQQYAR
ncbi:MAG: hypothetical protein NTW87_06905 [Planctomycetota bacterium]|nr:hypothetical protein [Planctomycetota bacterium]